MDTDDNREYEPHYLDDPDWDIADDEAEGHGWGVLFAHAALVLAGFLGWIYKPVIAAYFKPAPQVIQVGYGETFALQPGVVVSPQQHTITCGIAAPFARN